MTVPDRSGAAAFASKAARFDFSAAWREPNKSITDKIRQQLQVLRDLGLLEFLGSGSYRLHCASKCLICAINSSKKGGASFAPSS
jgi:Dam-replacing HTH domain